MKQALRKILSVTLAVVIAAGMAFALNCCGSSITNDTKQTEAITADAESSYTVTDYPLTRNTSSSSAICRMYVCALTKRCKRILN